MAQMFLNKLAGEHFDGESAGLTELQVTHEEIMKEVRKVRDAIKEKLTAWISETETETETETKIPPFKFGMYLLLLHPFLVFWWLVHSHD